MEYHYVYKITETDTLRYYIGSRTSKVIPSENMVETLVKKVEIDPNVLIKEIESIEI